jgi:hypothetical protein
VATSFQTPVSVSISDPTVVNIANNPTYDLAVDSFTSALSISCGGRNTNLPAGAYSITGSLCSCVARFIEDPANRTCNACALGFSEATCACRVSAATDAIHYRSPVWPTTVSFKSITTVSFKSDHNCVLQIGSQLCPSNRITAAVHYHGLAPARVHIHMGYSTGSAIAVAIRLAQQHQSTRWRPSTRPCRQPQTSARS